jgi:hypothetical protein
VIKKTEGQTRLYESQPLGVGVELAALSVFIHEVAEILDGGILRVGPVSFFEGRRWYLASPVYAMDSMDACGGGSIIEPRARMMSEDAKKGL